MKDSIDFNIDPATMDIVFDVMNYLDDNRAGIVARHAKVVAMFLRNDNNFTDDFAKAAFDDSFREFVRGLLKFEIMGEFNMPEEKLDVITEPEFLDLLTEGFFFDKSNYN